MASRLSGCRKTSWNPRSRGVDGGLGLGVDCGCGEHGGEAQRVRGTGIKPQALSADRRSGQCERHSHSHLSTFCLVKPLRSPESGITAHLRGQPSRVAITSENINNRFTKGPYVASEPLWPTYQRSHIHQLKRACTGRYRPSGSHRLPLWTTFKGLELRAAC